MLTTEMIHRKCTCKDCSLPLPHDSGAFLEVILHNIYDIHGIKTWHWKISILLDKSFVRIIQAKKNYLKNNIIYIKIWFVIIILTKIMIENNNFNKYLIENDDFDKKRESNHKLTLTLTPNTNPTPNHNPNSKKKILNCKINS